MQTTVPQWFTSNTKIAYPFKERVGGDPELSELLVDACYSHRLQPGEVRLTRLTDPSATQVDAIFEFTDGSPAFDTAQGTLLYRKKRSFGPWLLLEWAHSEKGVARLLLDQSMVGAFTWPVEPADARFVDYAIQYQPSQLLSVRRGPFIFNGLIELHAGFNVRLQETNNPAFTDTRPARGKRFVKLDVEGGLGQGKYVECDSSTPPVYTINGVGPDEDGNFVIDPGDCYQVRQPIDEAAQQGSAGPPWHVAPHTLKIWNHCQPCCDCDDYVYVYDTLLRRVYNRAKQVADRIYTLRDKYKDLVQRVQQEKTCREKPTLELQLVARHGWTATFQAIIRNNQACKIDYIYLDVVFKGPHRATYVEGSGYLNSKTIRQERFDPVVNDPCQSISLEQRMSSSSAGWITWKWPYWYDPCTDYPHFYVTVTEPLLGTDKLVITWQVYYPSYAGRAPGVQLLAEATGFVGNVPVEASVSTKMLGPHNKQ